MKKHIRIRFNLARRRGFSVGLEFKTACYPLGGFKTCLHIVLWSKSIHVYLIKDKQS